MRKKSYLVSDIFRHLLLTVLAVFWLIPIIWLVANSFSDKNAMYVDRFFPEKWTFKQYISVLTTSAPVCDFVNWFKNTLIVAIFVCIISSIFVLMVAYAMSCIKFRGRKLLMNVGVLLGLFPGFLSMIAIYFILKELGLNNTYLGLILAYSGSSGLGYLVAKGFFDTVSPSLAEAARLEGASELTVFTRIIMPLSKPIIVYTVINSFLAPWMDFVFARIIINSTDASDWTVAIGLYNMLDKSSIGTYFTRFCAAGVLISIPISILFVIMQKFYVEGVTSGATKG